MGSPGSAVAPTLEPLTLPEQPLTTCALPKLSLAGGEGVGVGDGGGPPASVQPTSVNNEKVRSLGGVTLCVRSLLMLGSINWLGNAEVSK